MKITFDSAKDEANRFKHGVSLPFGQRVFDDPMRQIIASFRPVDEEDRYKAVGTVDGRLYTVVYVERDETIRLISVRRSNDREQRDYYRHSGRPG